MINDAWLIQREECCFDRTYVTTDDAAFGFHNFRVVLGSSLRTITSPSDRDSDYSNLKNGDV
jgi:hypothetical protein